MKLLTSSNQQTKLARSLIYKFMTFGVHMTPDDRTCKYKSAECFKHCLNGEGRGVFSNVKDSRTAKREYYFNDQHAFMYQLRDEVRSAINSALKQKMTPCFRLNLTSDIDYTKFKFENGKNIMQCFPTFQFYDYTKNARMMLKKKPLNYFVVFSRSEKNERTVQRMLERGHWCAVVFKNELPKRYKGFAVVDGTQHDLIFTHGRLNNHANVIGLKALPKLRKTDSKFMVA